MSPEASISEDCLNPPVYIVGAGPGDPDLLTVAALKAIRIAEVVLYDRLVSDDILALIPESAEALYVGKLEGEQDSGQAEIFRQLVKAVNQGKRVLRLKGGDPLVFGRGVDEWRFIRDLGCDVRYIPGLSSSIAVPGLAGIPLTARGVSSSFAVLTGQLQKNGGQVNWKDYLSVQTIVILMGVKRRQEIAAELMAAGKVGEEPVAFIENGTCPNQRILISTLGQVAAGEVEVFSPAVFVIGEVCRFSEELGLFVNFSSSMPLRPRVSQEYL